MHLRTTNRKTWMEKLRTPPHQPKAITAITNRVAKKKKNAKRLCSSPTSRRIIARLPRIKTQVQKTPLKLNIQAPTETFQDYIIFPQKKGKSKQDPHALFYSNALIKRGATVTKLTCEPKVFVPTTSAAPFENNLVTTFPVKIG